MSLNIGVIGGGWAGLSAAIELTRAGHKVVVYEASKELGGRARRVTIDDATFDNGQHLLIGAYSETLRLMELVDPGSSSSGFLRLPLTLDYPENVFIRAPRLPAPLHLAGALLLAQGLSWADKLAALRFMRALKRIAFNPPAHTSVAEAIAHQPQRVRRYLWEPLCVAALNTPVASASYRVFAQVLKDALSGQAANSEFLIPTRDLTSLFPQPACAWLASHGNAVKTRCRINAISPARQGWKVSHADGEAAPNKIWHDKLIIATSAPHAANLLDGLPDSAGLIQQMHALQYQPIVTVYADYPAPLPFRSPLLGWVDPVPLFVFDLQASLGIVGRIAVVASASGAHLEWDDARWQQEIHVRMQQALGRQALAQLPVPKIVRRITEKRATFSCTPRLSRPALVTPYPGLFLAGDYTDGCYPSTLEGAVQSGVKCAQTLLASSA